MMIEKRYFDQLLFGYLECLPMKLDRELGKMIDNLIEYPRFHEISFVDIFLLKILE